MCTPDVEQFAALDVNHVRQEDGFQLHAGSVLHACQNEGPLAFCLVPPSSTLTRMCEGTRQDFFSRVLNRQAAISREDLPLVWDAPVYDSGPEASMQWISRGSPNVTAAQTSLGTYTGLQPVPFFVDAAMSDAYEVFLGVANGKLYSQNNNTGFVEAIDPSVVGGFDSGYQTVCVNTDASQRAVMFEDALFMWRLGAYQNIQPTGFANRCMQYFQPTNGALNWMVVSQNLNLWSMLFFSAAPGSDFEPVVNREYAFRNPGGSVLWASITDDAQSCIVAIAYASDSLFYDVFLLSVIDETPVLQWTVQRAIPTVELYQGRFTVVSRSSLDSGSVSVVAVNRNSRFAFQLALAAEQSVVQETVFGSPGALRVTEPINRAFATLTIGDTATYVSTAVATIAFQPVAGFGLASDAPLFVFPPSGLFTFVMDQPRTNAIYVNTNTVAGGAVFGTDWKTANYGLYLNESMVVSDFGTGLRPKPAQVWFFGYISTDVSTTDVIVYSPHQYYRVVLNGVEASTPTSFAFVRVDLQEANLYAMLASPSASLHLFDNSETSVVDASNQTRLRRFTSDAWFSANTFASAQFGRFFGPRAYPLASFNGLYLAFWSTGSFCVAFNVFNSVMFLDYCNADLSGERTARAVQRQADFCVANLQNPNSDENQQPEFMFSDSRCACLATDFVFGRLFPGKQATPVRVVATSPLDARLRSNLSCLLDVCQATNAEPEATISYAVSQQKCQKPTGIDFGAQRFTTGAATDLRFHSGFASQHNGINLTKCGIDSECPQNSFCVNGACSAGCTNDSECALGSACVNNVCLRSEPYVPRAESFAASGLLYVIVLGALLIVAVIMLVVVQKVKFKTKN